MRARGLSRCRGKESCPYVSVLCGARKAKREESRWVMSLGVRGRTDVIQRLRGRRGAIAALERVIAWRPGGVPATGASRATGDRRVTWAHLRSPTGHSKVSSPVRGLGLVLASQFARAPLTC